jgi:FkbM family methyltransferase
MQRSAVKPKNEYFVYQVLDYLLRRILHMIPPSSWSEQCALRWGFRFQPVPSVSRLRSGALMQTTSADYLQLLLYYLGTFEPYCLPYLKGCVPEGGVVLDVGANIGFYTVESALAVGTRGRVISIEAAADHLIALRKNIELNGMRNISVINSAVGDSVGHATLTLPNGDNLGMFTLAKVDGEQKYSVSVDTIDNLLAKEQIRSLDLVKMDIEGSEHKALLGATETFSRFRPALIVELNESALIRCGSSAAQVTRLLSSMNYHGWRIGRGRPERITDLRANYGCDECLFIHESNPSLIQKLRLPIEDRVSKPRAH